MTAFRHGTYGGEKPAACSHCAACAVDPSGLLPSSGESAYRDYDELAAIPMFHYGPVAPRMDATGALLETKGCV
jgi:hypothetical protein